MEIEDLKLLTKAVQDAKDVLHDAKCEFVTEHSKIKIGDIVTVTEYSHHGKSMVVESVQFLDSYKGQGVVAIGSVLKKDGTKGKFLGCHTEIEVKL